MSEQEILKKKITDAQEELRQLKDAEKFSKKNEAIKQLEDYTDDQKIKCFDEFYKDANEQLKEYEKNGYSHEDNAYYTWEAVIQILSKDNRKFWDYWNSLDH